MAALRRERARPLVPRAAVLAQPFQRLEVAALRRVPARPLVPRDILREAKRLQRLEISTPRSGSAQEKLVRQSTSSAQTLERAHISALGGIIFFEPLNLPPGRVHRVAHAFAHRAKRREIRGIGQVLFNNRHRDVERQPGNGDARLRVEDPLTLARTRPDAARRLGGHRGRGVGVGIVRRARVSVRRCEIWEKAFFSERPT